MQRMGMWIWMFAAVMLAGPGSVAAAPQPSWEDRAEARQIASALRDEAIEVVLRSARSDSAALRTNALEAAQTLPQRARPLAQLGLEDDNPAVRFSALVTIGRLELDGLGATSRRMSQDPEEHPSVRAAALYAARRCGEDVDLTPMARLLASTDPGVRANAAMVLGMLGDASAITMIKELAHAPMPRASAVREALVRLQIAEALVRLGDESALDAIRAGAYSAHHEVRVLAVQTLGKLGDRRMEVGYAQIARKENPIELRLAAAEALVRVGSSIEMDVMREGAAWDKPAVRAQAAFTLGQVEHPEAVRLLRAMMQDDANAQVRLAAATAILELLAPTGETGASGSSEGDG